MWVGCTWDEHEHDDLTRATPAHCTRVSQPTVSWEMNDFMACVYRTKSPKYLWISGLVLLWHLCLQASATLLLEWQAHIKTFLSFCWFGGCILLIQSCVVLTVVCIRNTRCILSQTFFFFVMFDNCMFSQASSTYYAWIQLKLCFVYYCITHFTKYISCMLL